MGARLKMTAGDLGDALAVRSIASVDVVSEITWSTLDARSDALARRLLELDVGARPATVVVLTRDAVRHAVAAYGAWKAGLTILCLSPKIGGAEASLILGRLGRTISVGDDVEWDCGERVGDTNLDEAGSIPPLEDRVPAPMMLIASGGSTGVPKLIDAIGPGRFSPGDFLAGLGTAMKREARRRAFVCTPLSHGAGAATAYLALFAECEVTSLERFDPDVALWAIDQFGLEQLTMVPTMMDRMLRSPGWSPSRLRSVRSIVHTGGKIDPVVKRGWIDAIGGENVIEVYGSTESVGHCVIAGDEWLERPGSVGRPVNCDVIVVGPDDEEVPVGTVGELFVRPRSAEVDPATKYVGSDLRMRSRGSFVSVGDLGRVDADGFVYIEGRTDDLIITGGVNVYPDEVETVVRRLPGVWDCIVVPRSHPDLGAAVHVVLSGDDRVLGMTVEALRAALAGEIAPYKMPRSLEVVAEIERSDAGKVRRSSYRPVASQPGNEVTA